MQNYGLLKKKQDYSQLFFFQRIFMKCLMNKIQLFVVAEE